MKRNNTRTKRASRRPARLKTLRVREELSATIPESSVKNERIKSAIEKGTVCALPSDTTTGHSIKKFEHIGKDGPLVVYAEDRKASNHFTVITSFKPSDSLRNQLFFGPRSSIQSNERRDIDQWTSTDHNMRGKIPDIEGKANNIEYIGQQKDNNDGGVRHKHRQTTTSFEGLVTRYKNRQNKYRRLLGEDAVYLLQKIDHLCKDKTECTGQKLTQKLENRPVEPVLPKIAVDNPADEPNKKHENDKISQDISKVSKTRKRERLPRLTVSKL